MGYENWGKCKKCQYADPTEKSGYSEWYKTYEDPDEVKECKQFKER
jgi:hypothetical protein